MINEGSANGLRLWTEDYFPIINVSIDNIDINLEKARILISTSFSRLFFFK